MKKCENSELIEKTVMDGENSEKVKRKIAKIRSEFQNIGYYFKIGGKSTL